MFSYVKNLGLKPRKAYKLRKKTTAIYLHHTVTDASPQAIHDYDVNRKGWNGIGYNVVVCKDGTVVWGRGLEYVGAHTYMHNSYSIGVAVQGNFQKVKMGSIQKEALKRVVLDILKKYSTIKTIKGHKEALFAATACPGKYYPLAEIKALLNERSDSTVVKTKTTVATTSKIEVRNLYLTDPYMSGDDVKAVQQKLVNHGYKISVDGEYGPKTRAAVIAFQRANGLEDDGIVGPLTLAALNEAPSKIDYQGLLKLKKPYIQSDYARAVQQALVDCGYDVGAIDGVYGPKTEKAVIKFQKDHGLEVDGIVGPKTIAKLNEVL